MSGEFHDLMKEVKHASKLVRNKEFDLADYYNHMGKYFDHMGLPEDAEEFRMLAKKWKKKKGNKDAN